MFFFFFVFSLNICSIWDAALILCWDPGRKEGANLTVLCLRAWEWLNLSFPNPKNPKSKTIGTCKASKSGVLSLRSPVLGRAPWTGTWHGFILPTSAQIYGGCWAKVICYSLSQSQTWKSSTEPQVCALKGSQWQTQKDGVIRSCTK